MAVVCCCQGACPIAPAGGWQEAAQVCDQLGMVSGGVQGWQAGVGLWGGGTKAASPPVTRPEEGE
jgi:hypothetical protein